MFHSFLGRIHPSFPPSFQASSRVESLGMMRKHSSDQNQFLAGSIPLTNFPGCFLFVFSALVYQSNVAELLGE